MKLAILTSSCAYFYIHSVCIDLNTNIQITHFTADIECEFLVYQTAERCNGSRSNDGWASTDIATRPSWLTAALIWVSLCICLLYLCKCGFAQILSYHTRAVPYVSLCQSILFVFMYLYINVLICVWIWSQYPCVFIFSFKWKTNFYLIKLQRDVGQLKTVFLKWFTRWVFDESPAQAWCFQLFVAR